MRHKREGIEGQIKKKIFVVDNYDSFTYNLVYMLRELGYGDGMRVALNDDFELQEPEAYDAILLSPGPGLPADAGLMSAVIDKYAPTKKILGVCLGHQAIGEAFGAQLVNMEEVYHGVVTPVAVLQYDVMFNNIPEVFTVCRYHSWSIDEAYFPEALEITSASPDGAVMSIRHKEYDVRGVQFHPESIMTRHGHAMLDNWIRL